MFSGTPNFLEFDVGHIITILDKNVSANMWSGVRDDNSHVGYFMPSQVVTYMDSVSKTSISSPLESSKSSSYSSTFNIFNSSALRKDSKKRWSHHEIQHKSQSSIDDTSRLIIPETSDMAPLISKSSLTQQKPVNRMGHTIGYIREKSSNPTFGVSSKKTESKPEKHEYHSISDNEEDDELFKPLDLGPSFMDEVFQELDQGNLKNSDANHSNKKDLKEIVSSTLHIRRHKKKQLATVRPIKASDEKALESAIAMANALASKSMHDIDKKSIDHYYEQSPGRSPITPNSPAKKFSFFFPSGNKSPKAERKPFSETAAASKDLATSISEQEKDAYRALVGESESLPPLTKLASPPIMSQSLACFPTSWNDHADHFLQLSPPPSIPAPPCPVTTVTPSEETPHLGASTTKLMPTLTTLPRNNPLPLPPKSHTLSRQNPPKRHVRKNPLIVPSAMVSNMIRNENVTMNLYSGGDRNMMTTTTKVENNPTYGNTTLTVNAFNNSLANNTPDDAFENAIAKDIDALDAIACEGAEESLFVDDCGNRGKLISRFVFLFFFCFKYSSTD